MSISDHIDESRLDLSDDVAFAKIIKRHRELSEIVQAGRQADSERQELNALIIAKLGNAKSAVTEDEIVSTQTVKRPEHVVRASTYRMVKVTRRVKPKPR